MVFSQPQNASLTVGVGLRHGAVPAEMYISVFVDDEENAAAQPEGMLRHRPNAVEQFVIAVEFRADREIYILVDGCQLDLRTGDKCKTHRAAGHLPVCGSGIQL